MASKTVRSSKKSIAITDREGFIACGIPKERGGFIYQVGDGFGVPVVGSSEGSMAEPVVRWGGGRRECPVG